MVGEMRFSKSEFNLLSRGVLVVALAWFSWLMLRITMEYIPPHEEVGFLQIKQQYIGIGHWMTAFWVHVFTSMFALLAGFTQFFPSVLRGSPSLHRWMGRAYVWNVCFVTGPASLIMAFYANGGPSSRIAFVFLASAWVFTTAMGWRAVLRRRWAEHREWMTRSYALTLSAITLRAWKWVLVLTFEPRPMDLYRLVAWLGFIPNLIVAEWLIRRRFDKSLVAQVHSAQS
jgi:hypothetical protein